MAANQCGLIAILSKFYAEITTKHTTMNTTNINICPLAIDILYVRAVAGERSYRNYFRKTFCKYEIYY